MPEPMTRTSTCEGKGASLSIGSCTDGTVQKGIVGASTGRSGDLSILCLRARYSASSCLMRSMTSLIRDNMTGPRSRSKNLFVHSAGDEEKRRNGEQRQSIDFYPFIRHLLAVPDRCCLRSDIKVTRSLSPDAGRRRTTNRTRSTRVILPLSTDRSHPPPSHTQWPHRRASLSLHRDPAYSFCLSLHCPAESLPGLVGVSRTPCSRRDRQWFSLSSCYTYTIAPEALVHSHGQ